MAKSKLMIIMGSALVVLVAGGYFAIRALLPDASVESVAVAAEEPEESIGEFYMIEGIAVNPAGTKGARFLRVSAALEVMDNGVLPELELRDVQLRDIMITELSANTTTQLMDPVSKEEIRSTIITKINRLLTTGALSNLYFLEYIVQ